MIINEMLIGAIVMASSILSLFFLRFWKMTKDSFFFYFAISFFLDGLSRLIMGTTSLQDQSILIYLIRMLGYLLIIYAILNKNNNKFLLPRMRMRAKDN